MGGLPVLERELWNWEFTLDILPELFQGLWVTVQAVFFGMLLALLVGLLWAICRRSSYRALSRTAGAAVEFLRSTPLLIQLFFLYYVLPDWGIFFPPFLIGIFGLGLYYSSYISEVYRAGIEGIPRGQWEAAKALNLSSYATYRHVILPQAIPPVIPALGNYLIAMFKDTPLLSAITVLEVLQRAKNIGNAEFRYLEPLTIVGGMYLILSLASGMMVRWLEGRLRLER